MMEVYLLYRVGPDTYSYSGQSEQLEGIYASHELAESAIPDESTFGTGIDFYYIEQAHIIGSD